MSTSNRVAELFATLDTNGTGVISKSDVLVALRVFSVESDKNFNSIFAELCPEDEKITLPVFTSIYEAVVSNSEEEKLISAFRVFDERGLEFLTTSEFRDIFERVMTPPWSTENVNAIVEQAQKLGNNGGSSNPGVIYYVPFVKQFLASQAAASAAAAANAKPKK